jgi:lactate dehydrogenase-like 2-hydroxyacid dehydrogenase
MNLVLLPDAQFQDDASIEQAILEPVARVEMFKAGHATEVPLELWRSCDAIMLWHVLPMEGRILDEMKRCKLIVRAGVGYDSIDLAACGAHGIAVCNVPDYGTSEVADHALALMLALTRGIVNYHETVAKDPVAGWDVPTSPLIPRLRGRTFGVLGMGRIGTAAARRAAAFGMRVVFHDPYLPDGAELGLGVERADSVAALAAQADVMSLHAPHTEETHNIVNAEVLKAMKPTAILVNTARGGLVDLDALTAALREGRIAGAGLDVLPEEPPVSGHPLLEAVSGRAPWTIGRVVITPHAAWYSQSSYVDMRSKAARTIREVLEGKPPRNCVNRQYLRGRSGG